MSAFETPLDENELFSEDETDVAYEGHNEIDVMDTSVDYVPAPAPTRGRKRSANLREATETSTNEEESGTNIDRRAKRPRETSPSRIKLPRGRTYEKYHGILGTLLRGYGSESEMEDNSLYRGNPFKLTPATWRASQLQPIPESSGEAAFPAHNRTQSYSQEPPVGSVPEEVPLPSSPLEVDTEMGVLNHDDGPNFLSNALNSAPGGSLDGSFSNDAPGNINEAPSFQAALRRRYVPPHLHPEDTDENSGRAASASLRTPDSAMDHRASGDGLFGSLQLSPDARDSHDSSPAARGRAPAALNTQPPPPHRDAEGTQQSTPSRQAPVAPTSDTHPPAASSVAGEGNNLSPNVREPTPAALLPAPPAHPSSDPAAGPPLPALQSRNDSTSTRVANGDDLSTTATASGPTQDSNSGPHVSRPSPGMTSSPSNSFPARLSSNSCWSTWMTRAKSGHTSGQTTPPSIANPLTQTTSNGQNVNPAPQASSGDHPQNTSNLTPNFYPPIVGTNVVVGRTRRTMEEATIRRVTAEQHRTPCRLRRQSTPGTP
ncbi:hypothetical protein PLICRDRAFT_170680 [Plicaturopsis crispa FD-325 SS-3]|nr:hypothetical protein PLICRDRAFT_170680 [Plicaturopsis crispa FD-325 SS-3]